MCRHNYFVFEFYYSPTRNMDSAEFKMKQFPKNEPLVSQLRHRELNMWPGLKNRSPKVWSNSIIDSRLEYSNKFYYKDLLGHHSCVNTVEFSADGNYMISGGDDRRVFLWRIWDAIDQPDYKPKIMTREHNANIFCLSFDQEQERIYSGGNDEIVIVHNIETGDAIDVMSHMSDVYGISVNPSNHNIFASASADVSIWDLRNSLNPQHLATGTGMFHGVMYNPVQSHMIATASSKDGIELYDVRQPLHRLSRFYPSYIMNNADAMCVRFNQTGNKILALSRKWPPVLYDVRSPYPQLLFDGDGYFNSCTLKHGSFAGQNDQFVISGSDNFFIYMWKIPDSVLNDSNQNNTLKHDSVEYVAKPTQVLTGHRSIVNQVRFNDQNGIIASAGVEKIIRLWSPLIAFNEEKSIDSKESNFSREFYYYEDFLENRISPNQDMSVEEDIRLIAYFDSMLVRDISLDFTSSEDDDDDSCSYFSPLMLEPSLAKVETSEKCSPVDCSSDFEEKFSIQKRIDFNAKPSDSRPPNDLIQEGQLDHLELVYAKRMHIRYMISIVENITKRIESMLPELRAVLGESKDFSGNRSTEDSNAEQRCSYDNNKNLFEMLRKKRCLLHQYRDLYHNIQNAKRYKLLVWANRIIIEMYCALISGTLFERTRRNIEIHTDWKLTIFIKFLENSEEFDRLICKMSIIKDRNLFDRKLHGIMCNLYKKVLKLAKLLNDLNANDPFTRTLRTRIRPFNSLFRVSDFLISDDDSVTSNSSGSSSLGSVYSLHLDEDDNVFMRRVSNNENGAEDVQMRDGEDSSTSDSTVSNVSLSDNDKGQNDQNDNEDPPESESHKEVNGVSENPVKNADAISVGTTASPSTSSAVTVNGANKQNVHFKKIDSRKRNYKKRSRIRKKINSKKARRH